MLPTHLEKQKLLEHLQEEQVIKQQRRKEKAGKEIACESPNSNRLLTELKSMEVNEIIRLREHSTLLAL
jgi:hypothetical protein